MKISNLLGRFAVICCAMANGCGGGSSSLTPPSGTGSVQHVIVVIGENHSFDNIFATYTPAGKQSVKNLLSEGIINADGGAGPNFSLAAQQQASNTTIYQIAPSKTGPFATLPQPNTAFLSIPVGPCAGDPLLCPDPGLTISDQNLLFEGGIGQPMAVPDCRYPSSLPNGPYQITGSYANNGCPSLEPINPIDNTGDPVHRFFQMWQQSDCSVTNATPEDPSGCLHDLYTWVAVTVGWALTGPPSTDQDTAQGSVAMGFFNMAKGDLPYLQSLAKTYSINDNYHQPFMGGSTVNGVAIGTADVMVFTDSNGNPATPPPNVIENPNPVPGTNNYYQNDLSSDEVIYVNTDVPYVDCSDVTQPGVAPIVNYLDSLPYKPFNSTNCQPDIYYNVNNIDPFYNTDGSVSDSSNTIGPQTLPTIGDELATHGISWAYFGEGLSRVNSPPPADLLYCADCNPFQYAKSIMTTALRNNIRDLPQVYNDVQNNTLPAVSFVKPDGLLDSHPGTSTPPLFEGFLQKLVSAVQANKKLWNSTAILITLDESGGEYDTGYIQPIDFFGDGPRTVMIAVSPLSRPGFVDHTYTDHASVLKFIEKVWHLPPLSSRSRDGLPNPIASSASSYVPSNSPAIGDLTTIFNL